MDTASGKATDVMKLLADKAKIKAQAVEPAIPSPDGRHLALAALTGTGRPPFKTLACVVDLKSGAVRKVAEGAMVQAGWSGPHLYVSAIDAKMQVGVTEQGLCGSGLRVDSVRFDDGSERFSRF